MDIIKYEMDVRREQLRTWIASRFRTRRAFCVAYGFNESEIAGLLRTKGFGSKRARNLETIIGMPFRYLEQTQDEPPGGPQSISEWPFRECSYADFVKLPPSKREELDIRVSEFIAGAIPKKM